MCVFQLCVCECSFFHVAFRIRKLAIACALKMCLAVNCNFIVLTLGHFDNCISVCMPLRNYAWTERSELHFAIDCSCQLLRAALRPVDCGF